MHEFYIYNGAWHDQDLTAITGGPVVAGRPSIANVVDAINNFYRIDYAGADSHVHELYIYDGTWYNQDLTAGVGGPAVAANSSIADSAAAPLVTSAEIGTHPYRNRRPIRHLRQRRRRWFPAPSQTVLTSAGPGRMAITHTT